MINYRFQSKDKNGKINQGTIAAENAIGAAQLLRAQGVQILQLAPDNSSNTSFSEKLKALNQSSGPSQKDILDFTTQLAVMIRAGINLRAAIEGIADQTTNPKFKKLLMGIKEDIESGKQFSEALAKHPKYFGQLYVNMVKASEMSGSFSHMLNRIASYLAQSIETKRMVIGAMIYPAVIGSMAVLVTFFLLTFVLPKFADVFKGKEAIMPGPTKFLMALSDFMVDWWWLMIIAAGFALIGTWLFSRTTPGVIFFDKVKLKTPIFRRMFKALYISRSLHSMGELINAGVPMLDTLRITGQISGNYYFTKLWNNVQESVKQGQKIAQPLQASTLLPSSVVQMISAGEESGKLGEVLEEVSDYYGKRLKEVIKTVTSMIEPVMIILMGSVVGFIAMAIILPIFKLSSMVN